MHDGSFFSAIHSTVHFHYLYHSSHTLMRKFWIDISMVYQLYTLNFSWFSLSKFIVLPLPRCISRLRATITLRSSFSPKRSRITFPRFTSSSSSSTCYRGLLIMCFFLSLGNRHSRSKRGYTRVHRVRLHPDLHDRCGVFSFRDIFFIVWEQAYSQRRTLNGSSVILSST